MDLFKMMKEAQKLQSTVKKAKKEIKKTVVEVEKEGIRVKINGEFRVINLEIINDALLKDKRKLEKAFLIALEEAHRNMEKVTKEKMNEFLKGMPIGDVDSLLS
ncbi:MAG TPA: YbaB/EbfC family nucleoid-associated protein [candidate division WOR-3 bacterium]|uniref:YbaB/EbfC family nucleoid-associated protein n=1 Tax=candidate division WOR-3 bacterium TaxID=2052148 RepID=A0A7V5HML6_UNCW3|nr:YbaB/EbfC family nucleoid-associated protein [candidate division WOR-3 bacterium]